MNTRPLSEEQFLKEIADHKVEVIRDDGVYRHLRFKRPDTICMFFDIVTWPGYLAYSGDMGCFVFSRVPDMLTFFRGPDSGPLKINLGYWSEKLQAVDGNRSNGSATEFSPEKFKRVIHEIRVSWIREYRDRLSKEERRELWESVTDQVLSSIESDHEQIAYKNAYEFEFKGESGKAFYFQDLFEYSFTECTPRFIWCCYAIAWGIRQYDLVKGDVSEKEKAA